MCLHTTNHIYNRGDELQENTWVYSVDKMNMVYRNQKLYVHLLHQTYCYHTLHNNQLAICTCALLDRYLRQQPPGGDEHNFWHISHYNTTDSDTIKCYEMMCVLLANGYIYRHILNEGFHYIVYYSQ